LNTELEKPDDACIIFVETNRKRHLMLTKVQKWGNSLALRIPKAFAIDARLENHSIVEISLSKGRIIVAPVSLPSWTLEELLAGVTKNNLHTEAETDPAVGREIW
jgi:antitoxin MazE